jgi:hypothetical protein
MTLDSFFIDCQTHKMDADRTFSLLECLLNWRPVDLPPSDFDSFLKLAVLLDNKELLKGIAHDGATIDILNVCTRLKQKCIVGFPVEEEIQFVASHFHEIDLEEMKGLEDSVLERIVSSDVLRLDSEDSLLSFICSLDLADDIFLLRYLRTEYLSSQGIRTFVEYLQLPDRNLEGLIWELLYRRLRLPVSLGESEYASATAARFVGAWPAVWPTPPKRPLEITEIPMTTEGRKRGIIWHLTQKHGGNIHERGVARITSSSVDDDPLHGATNVADLDSDSIFQSADEPNQWICWDFMEMRVQLTYYTVRGVGLRSWVVEGSMDGEDWAEIDSKTGFEHFKTGATVSFVLARTREFRFIRLTQTDTNYFGTNLLSVRAVEFFGRLAE